MVPDAVWPRRAITERLRSAGLDLLQSWRLAEKALWQGPRSSGDPEQARDEGGLSPHIPPANGPNLPLSDHRHPLVASQRSSCGWQTAKAQPRPDQAFDAPMVLLNDVVEVLDLAQPREAPQLTLALHRRDRGRIGRILVHRERARVPRVRLPKRLAEEPPGGRGIALGREQKVNRLAATVHRAIQVGPAAFHFDVCLVDPPRAVTPVQVWPDPLLQLWRISLDPAEDGRVVHRDATVLQHKLKIAIADRE